MNAKFINTALLASFLLFTAFIQPGLKTGQLKSSRVKAAYKNNWKNEQDWLIAHKISPSNFDLYIRVFKEEKLLEAWVKNCDNNAFTLYKSFAICAGSGVAGPKRRQGDLQVPEGFYDIPLLQPYSDYHLALKVGYPNKSDRIKSQLAGIKDPGGDIMIHGSCVTVGCIPLRDEPVEELYVLALEAMNRGRNLRCDIYPCRLSEQKIKFLEKNSSVENLTFLKNLKKAYDIFELNHSLPRVSIAKNGDYLVNHAN